MSATQWAAAYGMRKLEQDTGLPETTLRRVLLGTHRREPLRLLEQIATATMVWASHPARRKQGAPLGLEAWRKLWASARAVTEGAAP